MTRDELITYCLAKPGAEETYPWGDAELVAKVGGKAFAFIGLDGGRVGLKCGRNAAEAAEWRDRYPEAVTMSSYIGRHGWNSVEWTGEGPRRRGPRAGGRLLRRGGRRPPEEQAPGHRLRSRAGGRSAA